MRMNIDINGIEGRTAFSFADTLATIQQTPRTRVLVAGGITYNTIDDAIIATETGATIANEADIIINSLLPDKVAFSSVNPSIATVNSRGVVSYVSAGDALIDCDIGDVKAREVVAVSSSAGSSAQYLSDFVAGSLAKNACDAVDSRIAGKSASTTKDVFTTQNHAGSVYVRNTNLWCADLASKLTCVSPWNSAGGVYYAGTAVTPRHIIFAAHYQIPTGATVRFVTADNVVIDKVMTAKVVHPSYNGFDYPDLVIGVLSSDLPASITPCKVLPSIADYSPAIADNFPLTNIAAKIATLFFDQQERASVADYTYDNNTSGFSVAKYAYPVNAKRLEFNEVVVGGDSGNPSFLILNNELCLLSVFTNGFAGAGTSIRAFRSDINQMIVDADALAGISTGYTLTNIDLSGFTQF